MAGEDELALLPAFALPLVHGPFFPAVMAEPLFERGGRSAQGSPGLP